MAEAMKGATARPLCPCCGTRMGPFITDGRVLVRKVRRRGVMSQRALAWTRCQRMPFGSWRCGWGWWSAHPSMVAQAKRSKVFRLLRRQRQQLTRAGAGKGVRRGRGK